MILIRLLHTCNLDSVCLTTTIHLNCNSECLKVHNITFILHFGFNSSYCYHEHVDVCLCPYISLSSTKWCQGNVNHLFTPLFCSAFHVLVK